VTDTEDGVEEYVSRADLEQLFTAGVQINGLTGVPTRTGHYYLRVRVALPPSSYKASIMLARGLDVDISPDGELRRLSAVRENIDDRIVLGDFCTSVGADAYTGDGCPITSTLVFDDRIQSVSRRWVGWPSIKVDVSAVTREDVLTSIYYAKIQHIDDITDVDRQRYIKYTQLACIMTGYFMSDVVSTGLVNEPLCDSFILSKYKKELLRCIPKESVELKFKNERAKRIDAKVHLDWLRRIHNHAKAYEYLGNDPFYMKNLTSKLGVTKARPAFNYLMCGGEDKDIYNAVMSLSTRMMAMYGIKFPSKTIRWD